MKEKLMLRRQIYLTENQVGVLKNMSKEIGISISELVRRILDKFIKDNYDK